MIAKNICARFTVARLDATQPTPPHAAYDSSSNLPQPLAKHRLLVYYLLANIGFDTAENGPLKVCQKLANSQKRLEETYM